MKRTLTAVLASVMLLGACSGEETKDNAEALVDTNASAETTVAVKPTPIQGEDYDAAGGADAYANAGDNTESRYYKAPDFYNMKSDENLTSLPSIEKLNSLSAYTPVKIVLPFW